MDPSVGGRLFNGSFVLIQSIISPEETTTSECSFICTLSTMAAFTSTEYWRTILQFVVVVVVVVVVVAADLSRSVCPLIGPLNFLLADRRRLAGGKHRFQRLVRPNGKRIAIGVKWLPTIVSL